ncbi:MAG TPA: DUF1684 domain-containing protein [Bryobacteraceae bacterium]|jgi:hypothetical protein
MRASLLLVIAAIALLAADYSQDVAKFRADREKSLMREDGWTTVVGLSWLKTGENRIGSDPKSEVPLPASVPARVGTMTLHAGHVQFQPAPGVKLAPKELKPDSDILTLQTVKFYVIQRGDKFAIRVKDSEAPTRKQFTHLSWYAADPAWRVVANYTPWDKPHKVTFSTVIDGLTEDDTSPGYVTFSKDGKEYRLEPTADGNDLSFIFRDQTSGKDTYGAGRFLDTSAPKTGLKKPGQVILDFNEAYNPPCVYTAYATCPLPPPQNKLPLEIRAGELMYNGHH